MCPALPTCDNILGWGTRAQHRDLCIAHCLKLAHTKGQGPSRQWQCSHTTDMHMFCLVCITVRTHFVTCCTRRHSGQCQQWEQRATAASDDRSRSNISSSSNNSSERQQRAQQRPSQRVTAASDSSNHSSERSSDHSNEHSSDHSREHSSEHCSSSSRTLTPGIQLSPGRPAFIPNAKLLLAHPTSTLDARRARRSPNFHPGRTTSTPDGQLPPRVSGVDVGRPR